MSTCIGFMWIDYHDVFVGFGGPDEGPPAAVVAPVARSMVESSAGGETTKPAGCR